MELAKNGKKTKTPAPIETVPEKKKMSGKALKLLLLGLVVLLIAIFLYRNKQLIVVAKVNGDYVYSWELSKMLKDRYAATTLEDLITEELILKELEKNNIQVSEEELNTRIQEIEATLGGQPLEEALALQNITLENFRTQMYMRIGVDKLLAQQVTVTDAELDDYVKNYGDTLVGTTDEEKRNEARQQLQDQKTGDALESWLADLKAKATVVRYL